LYKKYLTLLLFTLISGNIINYSLQNLNFNHLFAAEDNSQPPEDDNQPVKEERNEPPKADDQKVSVEANDNVKITLEGNDDDKGDKIKFEIVADPSHGKLSNFDKSDGSVTYVPEKDYSGDDDFKFKVIDDKGAKSDTAEVKVSVKSIVQPNQGVSNEPNQGVSNEPNQGVSNEPNQGVSNEPNQGVSNEPNQGVSNESSSGSSNEPNQGVSNEPNQGVSNEPSSGSSNEPNQGVSNEPNQGVSNESNQGVENQTTMTSLQNDQVDALNKSPIAYDQSLSVDANDKIDIALVGGDADNDTIQFAIVSNPADATLDNFDITKGTLTYIPQTDYVGNDSFTFKAIDDKGAESDTATVNVDVTAPSTNIGVNDSANQAPTALDQSTSVDKNNQLNITLVGEDADNDTIQFAIVSNPSEASLDKFDTTKGTVTYIPQTDYVGNDSFTFKAIDDKGADSDTATVSVNVKENNQTNQAPQAFNQSINDSNLSNYRYVTWSVGEEEDRSILFARSTDGGKTFSSPVSMSGSSRSAVFNPEVSSSGNNVYVVWQGQSKNGNQDILLRKSSDYGSTFGETENISNDPGGSGNPEVTVDGNSTHIAWEGTTPGNNFIFYTKSDDGSAFDAPQKLSSNIGMSYKPELIVKDSPTDDSFTYKATDEKGAQSNLATVDVKIDKTHKSTLQDDVKRVSVDSNHEIDIALKANDKDNDTLQYEIVTPPSKGSLDNFDPSFGTVTYVPNENNEIDLSWHNYVNGHDRIMTKNVDNGGVDSASNKGIQNNDPFKAKR
jgi:hypothetical protein